MKLTKVRAQNLKGESFELELGDLTVLFGSNFKGKTARLDAIRLLLIGYIPELGMTARATFELCSGRELVVEGAFDDGSTISRRWFLKGDTVKTEESLPAWLDGANAGVVAVMLDPSVYFALGATAQVRYVFDNLSLTSADTPEEREAKLLSALDVEHVSADVKTFGEKLASSRRTMEADERFVRWTPQSHLEWLVAATTEIGKQSKEHAVRMDKTAQGLAYIRASETAKVDLAALDADRTALCATIDKAQAEKARHFAAFEQNRANRTRRETLSNQLRQVDGLKARRETLALSVDAKVHERDQLPASDEKALDQLLTEDVESRAAISAHERELVEVDRSLFRNKTERAGIDAKTSCPYCGATGEGWKALKLGEIDSAIAGLETKRDQLREHITTIRTHAGRVATQLEAARGARDRRATLDQEIEALRSMDVQVERTLIVLSTKAEELAQIPAEDSAAAAAVENAQSLLNVKTDELRRLDDRRKAAMGRANDLQRLARAEEERDAAKIEEEVAKAAGKLLKEAQREMIADAFKPLLEVANTIVGSILKSPLSYLDGEIGTWRDGTWVAHRVFSGTEKALAYAAIQAALAASSPCRIAVIDELGRLDEENVTKLVAGLTIALDHKLIDQFVGVDVGRRGFYEGAAQMLGVGLTAHAVS